MTFTDNPVKDAEVWLKEEDEWRESLPKCCNCQNPIDDDYFYDIEGDFYCFDCLKKLYRKDICEYMN